MPLMIVATLFAILMVKEADAETKPAEITIHIRGEHKAVISALLAAVDEETTRTGIAELDSLAATYGLMGIDRKGRSSGFYGYRFQLTFPPGSDRAAMAGAYWTLPYIQSTDPEPPPEARARKMHRPFNIENRGLRLLAKVAAGTGLGIVVTAMTLDIQAAIHEPSGNIDLLNSLVTGTAIGWSVGFPLGVSLVDPYDALPKTLLAGVIPGAVGFSYLLLNQDNAGIEAFFFLYVAPSIGSLIVSEKSRQPPQARRVSFALSPTLNGGFSAVAQLRF